ncbi:MAG: tetratricopeptide repeat protein [bacterium]|nr:MAG: tetratricopeptide repeat protein [bacterium]
MEWKSSLHWKITPPPHPSCYLRQRLFERLDRARTRPVVWICGPPGAGKTTLLSSYLHERKLPFLWYRIDGRDRDLAFFCRGLRACAEEVLGDLSTTFPAPMAHGISDVIAFSRDFFWALQEAFAQPFLLVLDDYHEIGDDAILRRVLTEAAGIMQEGRSLFVVGREEPPPGLAGLLARDKLASLHWSDLKLDMTEFRDLLDSFLPSSVPENLVQDLYRRSEGWVVGLRLLEQYLRPERSPQQELTDLKGDLTLQFFADEVVNNLSTETRDFLLAVSFLPFLSPKMAEEVAAVAGAERILGFLLRRNLFIEVLDAEEPLFRLHNMFRRFLLRRASSQWSPARLASARRRAGEVLQKSNHPEESVDLFIASQDWDRAAEIIRDIAPALMLQGRHQALKSWFEDLPDSTLDTRLLYMKGRNLLTVEPQRSQEMTGKAMQLFLESGDGSGAWLAWATHVSTFLVHQSDLKRIDVLLDQYRDLGGRFPLDDEDLETRTWVAVALFFALVFRKTGSPDLEEKKEAARRLADACGQPNLKVWFRFTECLMFVYRGDIRQLGTHLGGLRSAAEVPVVHSFLRLTEKVMSTVWGFYTFNRDFCLDSAGDGLRILEEKGLTIWASFLRCYRANLFLSEGDAVSARQELEDLEKRFETLTPWGRGDYHSRMAWYALLTQNQELAWHHAKTALEVSRPMGLAELHAENLVMMSRVALGTGDFETAEANLKEAIRTAVDSDNRLVMIPAYVLSAIMDYERGQEARGDDRLAGAFSMGMAQGVFNWSGWSDGVMSRLCSRALRAGIEQDYALELIARRNLSPAGPSWRFEAWPWPVKITTLGVFNVHVDGSALAKEGLSSKKQVELLKLLLAFGGKRVPTARLADALWPDSLGDHAQQNIKTTLHRLRRLLQHKEAVLVSEGAVSLNERICWVDLWALNDAMDELDRLLKTAPGGKADQPVLNDAAQVMGLYGGHFLDMEESLANVPAVRNRLASRYLDTAVRLGRHWEESSEWARAADLYERVLRTHPLVEETYRRLMICYHKMGRRAEAVAACHRCMEVLSSQIGAKISPLTKNLCDEIMNS